MLSSLLWVIHRGLWVFSEKPIAPHTASLVPCVQTHRHALTPSTRKYTFGLLEKHICVLIFPADIHECCLICARKKKTLSLHIIGRVGAAAVVAVVGGYIAKACGASPSQRHNFTLIKKICI